MSQPTASDVHVDAPLGAGRPSVGSGFKCSSCGKSMRDWRGGSKCHECRGREMVKFNPHHDRLGRFTTGPSALSYSGVDRLGPVEGPDRKPYGKPVGSSSSGPGRTAYPDSDRFVTSRAEARAERIASHRKVTRSHLSSSERADFDGLKEYQQDAYLDLRSTGWTHDDAMQARASYLPLAKESPSMSDLMFKCSSCSTPMEHWRDGSTCPSCTVAKAAAKPGASGAAGPKAQSTAKKPAGNVQDEFPKCPTCGTPTKTGEKCEDCKKGTERDHKVGDLTVAQMEAQAKEAEAESEEESERRDIRRRARAAMARMLGLDEMAKAAFEAMDHPPLVLKASTSKRFSFAPMYMPGKLDAHGEFVKSADELQQAAWDYVRKTANDRTVYLQHIGKAAGEWVEITSWPYAVEALMSMPNADGTRSVRKATLPAGTVYMGVQWEPWAWELVQKGRLLGFSMGGWAKRVQAELADESVTKNADVPRHREPWDEVGLVNPNHRGAVRRLLPHNG